jgi:error-prone DNA polymerase
MGFYPPDSLTHEAQLRGVEVRAVDVNESEVECTVEPRTPRDEGRPSSLEPAVRFGLGYIKGIGEEDAAALVAERARGGRYRDLADLASRSGISRESLERLAWAGACEPLGHAAGAAPRRDELWRLGVARGGERVRGRSYAQLALPLPLPAAPNLRTLDSWERIVADYTSTGVTLGEHPIEVLRPELEQGLIRSDDLRVVADRTAVRIAGLVVARQRPATAKGVVFMLLEDEVGVANVIVPPPVYERCRLAVRTASFALISGRLERRENVINVLADSVERLSVPAHGAGGAVRQIEPPVERETGREPEQSEQVAAVAAVAPRAHSFGRRG